LVIAVPGVLVLMAMIGGVWFGKNYGAVPTVQITPPTPQEIVRTVVVVEVHTATPAPTFTPTLQPMHISEMGKKMIQYFEGLSLVASWDIGRHCAIGWGHGVEDMWCLGELKISRDQADKWFAEDVRAVERFLSGELGGTRLNQCQYDAVASFTFNLGDYYFQVSGMRLALMSGDHLKVLKIFAKYTYSEGIYVEGLAVRRAVEAKLYEECIYPDSI